MSSSYSSMVINHRSSDIRLSRIYNLSGFQLRIRSDKKKARAQPLRVIDRDIQKRWSKLWQLNKVSKSSTRLDSSKSHSLEANMRFTVSGRDDRHRSSDGCEKYTYEKTIHYLHGMSYTIGVLYRASIAGSGGR